MQAMEPFVNSVTVAYVVTLDIPKLYVAGVLNTSYRDELFRKADIVRIQPANGFWTSTIPLPAASNFSVVGVEYVHYAGWGSTLQYNGVSRSMKTGDRLNLKSNGTVWVEVASLGQMVTRKPVGFGVPVTTVLGYYDPEGQMTSYLYPAAHGGYGYVYEDDTSIIKPALDCFLEVQGAGGAIQRSA